MSEWLLYFYNLLHWLYPLPLIFGLIVSLRNSRLSKTAPYMAGGFAVALVASLVSLALQAAIPYWASYVGNSNGRSLLTNGHSLITVGSSGFSASLQLLSVVSLLTSVATLAGWTLITTGMALVFNDMRQKLALLEIDAQSGWRYTHSKESILEQSREENHASAFVPASMPLPVTPGPAYVVRPDQSDATITLGSSHS